MNTKMTMIQRLAFVYGIIFLLVVGLNAVPGIHDNDGHLFGLFKLDFIDDVLHLASALWAAWAGWHSARAASIYFQWFGPIYFFDGLLGLLVGNGYLDLAIFFSDPASTEMWTRFALNVPHLILGGVAVFIGFFLNKKSFVG